MAFKTNSTINATDHSIAEQLRTQINIEFNVNISVY